MTGSQLAAAQAARPDHRCLQTSCGRVLEVGTMRLGDEHRPIGRVTMRIGQCPNCGDGSWAALSPADARELAVALLAHAGQAETDDHDSSSAGRVDVTSAGGDSYLVGTRGHAVLVDQPVADGGTDAGATPTELMVASLASCVAFYVGRYLRRHQLEHAGMQVRADFVMAGDRPARIGDVRLAIEVPGGVPADRRRALLAVASHCTVHNTLQQPPEVSITLD
jgi:putative redox protein